MGTVFSPTYENLSMGYHEIKHYDLIKSNYNLDVRQYFKENWKRFLDDCEILLNTDLIKRVALWLGGVTLWLAICARKPKVPGSSPAASYAQR